MSARSVPGLDRCRAVVLALIVVSFALRLYRLPFHSLSYDESVSVYLATMSVRELLQWTAADVQPPLYYLLLKCWGGLTGNTEYSLRLLSVILSVAALPLIYRLARLQSGRVAVIAVLVASVHPWYVWHAQDARMYSLLLLAGTAATLALTRRQQAAGSSRSDVALVLAYTALLYTHYLGGALILAHFLLVAWRSLRVDGGRSLARYAVRILVPTALLFAPWLPAVLSTMRSDTSYWSSSLKPAEASRKVLTALFVGGPGETVLEAVGIRLAAVMVVTLGLALLVRRGRDTLPPLATSLITLAATLAAFAIVPKFNPRYLILASIPLPILWGQAVSLLRPGPGESAQRRKRVLGATALGVVVVGSAYGLAGMYRDVRLTRADFRGAIAHVLAHELPDEATILVSGHMYPVWQYYAPNVPYLALPEMRVLDVGSSLDLTVSDDLASRLKGTSGAWVVFWQDEIADPMGAVTFLLDQTAQAEQTEFWHVKVRHYRYETSPEPVGVEAASGGAGCRFEDGMEYLGRIPDAAGNTALLWRAEHEMDIDLRAQVTVTDAAGHQILRTHLSPGGDHYPTSLWAPGQTAFVRLNPDTPPGIDSGSYRTELTLYRADSGQPLSVLDAAGNPAGQVCSIGNMELGGNTVGVDPAETAAGYGLHLVENLAARSGLTALGDCPTAPLPPGSDFTLPLLVECVPGAVNAGTTVRAVAVYGDGGEVTLGEVTVPGSGEATAPSVHLVWLDGRVPADAESGETGLHLRLLGPSGTLQDIPACTLNVAEVTRDYDQVAPLIPAEAVIGEIVNFLGLDAVATASPGDTLRTVLHFRTLATPDENYSVFVHLLGPDGRLAAQANAQPAGRPTAGWLPGEMAHVELEVAVPADAAAGIYTFEIGWFLPEAEGMPRLSVTVGGNAVAGDSIGVGQLAVR